MNRALKPFGPFSGNFGPMDGSHSILLSSIFQSCGCSLPAVQEGESRAKKGEARLTSSGKWSSWGCFNIVDLRERMLSIPRRGLAVYHVEHLCTRARSKMCFLRKICPSVICFHLCLVGRPQPQAAKFIAVIACLGSSP
jgi:hypothetical protein